METPVVMIIFRRPDTSAQVFARIREAKPCQLFVIADGPRDDHPQEANLVAHTRAMIDNGIDWECEVLKDYAESNLGLKDRVQSGLQWVFEQTDRAIILEDDTLPHPSFFEFCEQMLDYYAADERVMMVSGYNPVDDWNSEQQSYVFSHLTSIWGWATWQRAWKYYEPTAQSFLQPENRVQIRQVLQRRVFYDEITPMWQKTISGEIDTWDTQWEYSMLKCGGLCAASSVNLISNVGFRADATHTKWKNDINNTRPIYPAKLPLIHPPEVKADRAFDRERTIRRQNMWRRRAWLFRLRYWLRI